MSATYRVVTVDSKISHPSAAISFPDVGTVLFILICGLWSEDLVRCVHSDRALVCGYLKSFALCASVLPCLRILGECFDLLFVQILNAVSRGPLSLVNLWDE